MVRRRMVWVALATASLSLFAPAASAEMNLWVCFHYAGEDAYNNADYGDAETLIRAAKTETDVAHRQAFSIDALGSAYFSRMEYAQAEMCFLEALRLKEKSLGKRSREVPVTLNNLADLYYLGDRLGEAEKLYRRALDIHERDPWNVEVCRSLNGLALLRNDTGDYVQAEKLLKRAIAIHDKTQRRRHPYQATVLVNLGIMYMNLDRIEEVEPLFLRAESIQDAVVRKNHPDVAVRLEAHAALLNVTGRLDEAEAMQEQAKVIFAERKRTDVPE
jgi:tetratricopeptide (TPR) repeat protein